MLFDFEEKIIERICLCDVVCVCTCYVFFLIFFYIVTIENDHAAFKTKGGCEIFKMIQWIKNLYTDVMNYLYYTDFTGFWWI